MEGSNVAQDSFVTIQGLIRGSHGVIHPANQKMIRPIITFDFSRTYHVVATLL
jgi:hypothetical protein